MTAKKFMRIVVILDDKLVADAMRYSGLTTQQAVIEEALRHFVRLKSQEEIRTLRGQLRWEGDLDAMRQTRILSTAEPPPADS